MGRCVLTLGGLAWVAGVAVLCWLGLFAWVAFLNRWARGDGDGSWDMSRKSEP